MQSLLSMFNFSQKKKEDHNYITLVDNAEKTSQIVKDVLLKQSVLALDCEGIHLSKEGALTLIQVNLTLILLIFHYFRLA